MKKETRDINQKTNLDDITKAFKKAIKFVPVNWKGRELEIPVHYGMNAVIAYDQAFKETKNYRKSFCAMVLEMVNNNQKKIYNEGEFPILHMNDIEGLSDYDLIKIGEEIINSSDYLKRFEEAYKEADDFFKKFYLIHKKEIEVFTKQMKKIAKQMDRYEKLLQNIELASKIGMITENIIKMQSVIAPYVTMTNTALQNFYSEINAIKDILQPNILEYARKALENQELLKKAININLQSQIQILGAKLNDILNFTYNDKLFNFIDIRQSIINNMKPFLLDIQTVLILKENIEKSLKDKAKTMFQFGWCYISSLPQEIINYIHINKESLLQEDVDKMVCDHYKASDYKELESMIKQWYELKYFYKWRNKIDDAFWAHKLGKYSLSIPLWAILPEGIIRDFMRDVYNVSAYGFGRLYENFKEKVQDLDYFIIDYVFLWIDLFYNDFHPEKPEKVQDFNRHKILHGLALNYDNEINSLKLILYLDELFHMISSLKSLNIA